MAQGATALAGGALRVILVTFYNLDTCMALQALPQGIALLRGIAEAQNQLAGRRSL